MVHRETKEVPAYALLASKSGLKLPDADPATCVTFGIDTSNSSAPNPCGGLMVTPNRLENQKISMQWFASTLSGIVGRPVIDRTGYTGTFQVHLEFAAEAAVDASRPSIFTALQEQLGLKLESQKAPGQILVIDHVERVPTEN